MLSTMMRASSPHPLRIVTTTLIRSITTIPSSFIAVTPAFSRPSISSIVPMQVRGMVKMPIENWKLGREYLAPAMEEKKQTFVPKSRGDIIDPKSFLTAIGRGCADYAPKFTSWDHLFLATTDEMATTLAIPTKARKYILGWREWFKRGRDPYHVRIPKRAKKYLKLREHFKLERLKREGKA